MKREVSTAKLAKPKKGCSDAPVNATESQKTKKSTRNISYQTTNRIFARINLQVSYVSATESYL